MVNVLQLATKQMIFNASCWFSSFIKNSFCASSYFRECYLCFSGRSPVSGNSLYCKCCKCTMVDVEHFNVGVSRTTLQHFLNKSRVCNMHALHSINALYCAIDEKQQFSHYNSFFFCKKIS